MRCGVFGTWGRRDGDESGGPVQSGGAMHGRTWNAGNGGASRWLRRGGGVGIRSAAGGRCCEDALADEVRGLRHLGPTRRGRKRRSGAERRRYARADLERREWWRKQMAASRRRRWYPVGGWRKGADGYGFAVLGPWAVGLCPAHGGPQEARPAASP